MRRLLSLVVIALLMNSSAFYGPCYGSCEEQHEVQELYRACENGDIGEAQRFMTFEDELYRQHGLTPLHLAAIHNRPELVRYLLESAQRKGCLSEMINCATGEAYVTGTWKKLLEILTKEKWEKIPLSRSYGWSWVQAQFPGQRVFTLGDVLVRVYGSRIIRIPYTPLCIACNEGHTDVVSCLIEFGADIHDATVGKTPLCVASRNGHAAIVKILILAGADPNKARHDGCTPLAIACQKGHLNVVGLLCQAGARIEELLPSGARPLHVAIMHGKFDVADYLIRCEADMDALYERFSARELYQRHHEVSHHKMLHKQMAS